MPEYRSHFDLPPTQLERADLTALDQLLSDGIPLNPYTKYTVKRGDVSYSAQSIGELFAQLPTEIDEIDFQVLGWSEENKVNRGVSIRLNPLAAYCQIHSMDEFWFHGKIAQINKFFAGRRPWYAGLRANIASCASALLVVFLVATLYLVYGGSYSWAALAATTQVGLLVMMDRVMKGKLFPRSRITLSESRRGLNKDVLMVLFTAIGALATLIGVVIQLWPKPPH